MSCSTKPLKKKHSGTTDPEGVVKGWPGNSYLNTTTETVWFKKTGNGTKTGWIQVIG
jgi:hypothetical protein